MKLIKKLNTKRNKNDHMVRWALFLCEYCNKVIEINHHDGMRNKSCGCAKNKLISIKLIKHGDCQNNKISRLYRIWCNMKQRCYNPKENDIKYYKNKGIKICNEWKSNYLEFKKWALNNGYKNNLTIDRINSNYDYCPNNCQWLTLANNVNKNRYTKLSWSKVHMIRQVIYNKLCNIKELANIYNISITLVKRIIQNKCWKEEVIYNGS